MWVTYITVFSNAGGIGGTAQPVHAIIAEDRITNRTTTAPIPLAGP